MQLSDTMTVNLEARHFERVLRQSRLEAAVSLLSVGIAAAAARGLVPRALLFAFVASALVFTFGRLVQGEIHRRRPAAPGSFPLQRALFVALIAGSALSFGLLAAYVVRAHGTPAALPLLTVTLTAALAPVGLYAGTFAAGLASALCGLLPPVAALLAGSGREALLTGGALVVLTATAIAVARLLRRYDWERALLESENEQMHGHLDQRRTQIEKLNVALKTTQGKREQAEQNLRRTAADLGLVQGKAKALADTLERISPMCQVTGLANRRHFDQVLESEWRRAARELKPLAMILLDLDDYEEYVTTYGGHSADALLKRVGQVLKGFGRRAGDTAGRYDESRLALLLPGCDARNAGRMADAIRKRVESQAIVHANAKNRQIVTVHIGVAMIKPTRALKPEELIKRVEAALYEARFQGGNKTVVYQPLSKLRLERWDPPTDGPLNEQSLMQKLLVWGYDTAKQIMRPHTAVEPQLLQDEQVLAILTGELAIDVEGHSMRIQPGDCVFVPRGVELGLEVTSDVPVVKLTAIRHK